MQFLLERMYHRKHHFPKKSSEGQIQHTEGKSHYNNYHTTTLLVQIQLGSDQWSVYERYSNFCQFM